MSASEQQILFVCTGNTCRSPMAERLMRHLCRSLSGWTFRSAGVFAAEGAPASEGAIQALKEKGLDLRDHQTRILSPKLMDEATWVIAMTAEHARLAREQVPEGSGKVRTLHSFSHHDPLRDVRDPFGGNLDTYRATRDEIESALTDLILALIQPSSQP
jgi:protein-tyrosine phosphatase